MAVTEIALEWAGRVLEAFDTGKVGQYGPYTIEIGKSRVLRRGSTIELKWPAGKRVKITAPSVDGNNGYVGRLGWAWRNLGEADLRVVPDGCGWGQRDGLYKEDNVVEVSP